MRTFLKQRFAVALLAIGTTMALMTVCGTANTDSLSKAERKRIQEMKVKEMLDNRHFKIEVDMMHPHTYPARQLSSYYSVEVRNDSLISYLPYMGRAYSVPYGGGKALNFEAPLKNYKEVEGSRNLRRIYVQVYNDEDIYTYMFEVFANGKSTVHVDSRNRQPISFDGDVVTEENKK